MGAKDEAMSKRTIAVTIDAGEKTCGRCEYKYKDILERTSENGCDVFGEIMKHDNRCEDCLAAEKAYKEDTHGKA